MTWLVAGALLPSLMVCWLLTFAIRGFAGRLGLVDQPGERKVHKRATPLGGGLGIWAGVVVPLAVGQFLLHQTQSGQLDLRADAVPSWARSLVALVEPHLAGLASQSGALWILLGSATVLMLLGLFDDIFKLDWRLRLAVQMAVAIVIVAATDWQSTLFLELPYLTGAMSVVWIVTITNSFNMLDNMDGLSAGVAAIASGLLAAVVLIAPDPATGGPQLFVAGVLLVLLGSLLGFLAHNWHPARIFMGDAGSYFVGYLLAVITLIASFAGGALPRHAILAPLCIFAIPLYDMISVIVIRLRSGRSPFDGDTSHFSHRLVQLGLSQRQAVATVYLATFACGLCALLLHQLSLAAAVIVLMIVVCVLVLVAILECSSRRPPGVETPATDRDPQ